MSRSLIVLPDDSVQPILDAIHHAKTSLRIKMFVFTDPSLLTAVIDAHRRGVKVRIMLKPEAAQWRFRERRKPRPTGSCRHRSARQQSRL